MDIDIVKNYLRVDYDEDDELIKVMMNAAERYISSAIGSCDLSDGRVQVLYLQLITQMYNDRLLVTTADREQRMVLIVRSLITQLQIEELM